ncbi:MAG: hypothetical protein R8G66_06460 [Cytophagales bacterium]|nr:hypothetical protein [Cytophagales bacterium]
MNKYLWVSFLMLLFLAACHKETEEYDYRRVIINSCSRNITLDIFHPSYSMSSEIDLESGMQDRSRAICRVAESANFICEVDWSFADSIIVTFDGERKLKYCRVEGSGCFFDGERNIIDMPQLGVDGGTQAGWQTSRSGGSVTQTYTITEEDYQNAEPI